MVCISIFKQLDDINFVILKDLVLDPTKLARDELIRGVYNVTANLTLQFYLVLIQQLKDLDPMYEIFILLKALSDPQIDRAVDRNLIYERLYHSASLIPQQNGGGLDFMYKAVMGIKDEEKEKALMG